MASKATKALAPRPPSWRAANRKEMIIFRAAYILPLDPEVHR